jgi:hypothetical protein
MNDNLLAIVKQIAAEYGEEVLGYAKRLKARLHGSGGDFFAYKFAYDIGRSRAGLLRFGLDVVCRKRIKAGEQDALGGKYTGDGSQLRGSARQFLVQRVIFRVGHVSAKMFTFHSMFLYAKFFTKLSAAFHSMKYFDCFAVYAVIHDLKQITRMVKTDNNIFIVKSFHKHVYNMGLENIPNVGLVNPMLKCGRNADNFLFHNQFWYKMPKKAR